MRTFDHRTGGACLEQLMMSPIFTCSEFMLTVYQTGREWSSKIRYRIQALKNESRMEFESS